VEALPVFIDEATHATEKWRVRRSREPGRRRRIYRMEMRFALVRIALGHLVPGFARANIAGKNLHIDRFKSGGVWMLVF
ncbi:hypothetical protein OFC04_27480, partial [Escherichia coli]|nr:hypothetical protein [Escherichia coli]